MDNWTISYADYQSEEQAKREALLATGNGYIMLRGAFEETHDDETHYPGTYLAGGYNRLKTDVSGKEIENEDLVNWPNPLPLTFCINDGKPFHIDQVNIQEFQNDLNLQSGVLSRKIKFTDQEGNTSSLISKRFVSMDSMHIIGLEWELIPENWEGNLRITSSIDGTVINNNVARYSDLNSKHLEVTGTNHPATNTISLVAQANQSKVRMAIASRTEIFIENKHVQTSNHFEGKNGKAILDLDLSVSKLQPVHLEKIITLYTSKDVAISEPLFQAENSIRKLPRFKELLQQHESVWKNLWEKIDTTVESNEDNSDQKILRLHTFHILQTVSNHTVNIDAGVPSRGWHGEAYRGHIFWDEMYIMPFLILHLPHIAHHLLMYRYRRLPEARKAAKEAGFEGAMFPWQSGSDGREESQKIHLNPESGNWIPDNSHQQRHINITIIYNVWQYYQATKDMEFLSYYGAELILSVALFWSSIAQFDRKKSRYVVNGVMGPDEYHTKYPDSEELGLNNNAYTNLMVVWVIQRALDVLNLFDNGQYKQVIETVGIREEHINKWKDMCEKMYIPFHDDRIISQFEGYENLEEFDWDRYKNEHGEVMRLDRILEKEGDTPNRYKASKQADVLMIFFLLSSSEVKEIMNALDYPFDIQKDIEKNIHYYQRRTSHGSTLSKVVHSWIFARLNRTKSWKNFEQALMSDFKDVQGGTTPEGIHLGAMAGTVDLIQRCYTGMQIRNDILWINPHLPESLEKIILSIRFRSHWFKLYMNHKRIIIEFEKGWAPPVKLGIQGKTYQFEERSKREFELKKK
jgi:trehalose/maltose hydrolase-like predicted phosphorylase